MARGLSGLSRLLNYGETAGSSVDARVINSTHNSPMAIALLTHQA